MILENNNKEKVDHTVGAEEQNAGMSAVIFMNGVRNNGG